MRNYGALFLGERTCVPTVTRPSAPTTCCPPSAPPATPAASGSASSSRPSLTRRSSTTMQAPNSGASADVLPAGELRGPRPLRRLRAAKYGGDTLPWGEHRFGAVNSRRRRPTLTRAAPPTPAAPAAGVRGSQCTTTQHCRTEQRMALQPHATTATVAQPTSPAECPSRGEHATRIEADSLGDRARYPPAPTTASTPPARSRTSRSPAIPHRATPTSSRPSRCVKQAAARANRELGLLDTRARRRDRRAPARRSAAVRCTTSSSSTSSRAAPAPRRT